MKNRNMFLMFLLLGSLEWFYLFYWQGSIQNDIVRHKRQEVSGGLTVLFSILSFGIYAMVWQWKICKFLQERGCRDLKIITLIMSLLIVGILINPFLIQGEINAYLEPRNQDLEFKL